MDLSRILGVSLALDQFASLQQIESVGENIARRAAPANQLNCTIAIEKLISSLL
jgi:hypothetical protein